jgi:hypothetical protein
MKSREIIDDFLQSCACRIARANSAASRMSSRWFRSAGTVSNQLPTGELNSAPPPCNLSAKLIDLDVKPGRLVKKCRFQLFVDSCPVLRGNSMACIRSWARFAALLLLVLVLTFGWRLAAVVAAKDNDQPEKKSAGAARDSADSKDSKASKDKKSASAKKKTEASKKGKKGAEDSSDESSSASGSASGGQGGSGGLPYGGSSANSGSVKAGNAGQQPSATGSSGKASNAGGNAAKVGAGPQAAVGGNPPLDASHPVVKKVIAAQTRISPELFKQKGIVGTSTGLDDEGNVVIRVQTTGADSPKIPKQVDGINVIEVLTGPIHLHWQGSAFNTQARQTRPVPLGVSAFDDVDLSAFSCAAGTLGCRLKDNQGNVYALSNNHVFAGENLTQGGVQIGTPVVQPSPGDNNCVTGIVSDQIGNLFKFKQVELINFNLLTFNFPPNLIDAAIITTDRALVSKSTPAPPVAYGTPRSITWKKPILGMGVMKFGRTTGFTHGMIIGINQFVFVPYANGIASFVNQIEIAPTNGIAFSNPGDSGSLIVTEDILGDRFPIALLFAGGGGFTAANPIQDVLDFFGLTIDGDDEPVPAVGKSGRSDPNVP